VPIDDCRLPIEIVDWRLPIEIVDWRLAIEGLRVDGRVID
jgi:hypothetical protein